MSTHQFPDPHARRREYREIGTELVELRSIGPLTRAELLSYVARLKRLTRRTLAFMDVDPAPDHIRRLVAQLEVLEQHCDDYLICRREYCEAIPVDWHLNPPGACEQILIEWGRIKARYPFVDEANSAVNALLLELQQQLRPVNEPELRRATEG
jgi:hypothetical protein